MKTDVVFYEVFAEEKLLLKKFLPKKIRAAFYKGTIQEEGHATPKAKLLCVRTQSIIPTAWLKNIDGVLTRSEGDDHLSGIKGVVPVGRLYGYCVRAVAEHALLLILALAKDLKKQIASAEVFCRDGLTCHELRSKKVLVVGVGKVGEELVRLCRGVGMDARGVDIICRIKNLSYVSLNKGVHWADVIVCSAALTDKTRGFLNYALLKKAHKGTILVNVSRGEITPLKDMKRLLDEKILGGLGLDVFDNEAGLAVSLRQGKKGTGFVSLSRRSNVIFTPHNAFNTHEALMEKCRQSVIVIECFLRTNKFPAEVR